MNATMMTKATEQLTNPLLRLTYCRLGTRVTAVRQSTKGVPKIVKGMQSWTKEQREDWFKEKTANCYAEKRADIRSRLDKMNEIDDRSIFSIAQNRFSKRNIFEYLKDADLENLKRAIDIISTKLIPRRKEQDDRNAEEEINKRLQEQEKQLSKAVAELEAIRAIRTIRANRAIP